MQSFLGDQKVKEKYLERVRLHRDADEIVKGKYWQDGKGCAVGCTIHSDKHNAYETELGIPEWLARVEDTIFEGLPNERALSWPHEFLSAIPVGKDLETVKTPFIIFILESSVQSMERAQYDAAKFPDVKAAIDQSKEAVKQMIEAHKTGSDLSGWSARSAARSARSAAWSARSAARSAAWSAESAAESAAWSAESAAWSARSAAESARSAAWSAAWSAARSAAESARSAAWSAAWSAWSAEYVKFADKLLELLHT